jgi:1-acyl-sn-glycerol-3-phosphate acyltransferase
MMAVGRRLRRTLFFMAAWQIFENHRGIDGWVMQRMGAFSVDREGCDRRAIRQATELLTSGRSLVVFPEGEVFHLNARLTPLKEGVAFIVLSAQRDLEKQGKGARVWVAPTAIRYRYVDDVRLVLQLYSYPGDYLAEEPSLERMAELAGSNGVAAQAL